MPIKNTWNLVSTNNNPQLIGSSQQTESKDAVLDALRYYAASNHITLNESDIAIRKITEDLFSVKYNGMLYELRRITD